MLKEEGVKRSPKKFPEIDGLDRELDEIVKSVNSKMLVLIKYLNGLSSWMSGKGAPNNNLGKNGDFYLDEDSKDIYKKVNGSWL